MALKLKLTTEEFTALDGGMKGAYVKLDDGSYKLDADGVEDTTGLKSALQKKKDELEEAKNALKSIEKKFEGIDAEEVKKLLAKFEGDDDAKLIKEGKIDEVINKRTERMRADYDKKLQDATKKVEQADGRAKKFSQRVLDDQIREAASKAGLHASAIEDALFRGRSMFSLDEEGKAVQLGEDGKPVMGKDGKAPFAPTEWIGTMKESAPHWFPAPSNGGGAGGSNGRQNANGATDPTLSPAQRITAARAAQGHH